MFRKEADENFGDFKRLHVANGGRKKWQLLLLFDLTLVSEAFRTVVGVATLSVYPVLRRSGRWRAETG